MKLNYFLKTLFTVLCCMFFWQAASAQTQYSISTFAGGSIGNGAAATSATLNNPSNVVFDHAKNMYIVDASNNVIRKVDVNTGIISNVAGNGGYGFTGDGGLATKASLNYPTDVAFDSADNMYIVDCVNHRIRRVDGATGIISTIAGNGNSGFSGDGGAATSASLTYPEELAVDKAGNIYIADELNQRIRKVDAITGIMSTVAGNGSIGYSGDGGLATGAKLKYPKGVAVDTSGNIYISDSQNNCIRKVDATSGIITTVVGNGVDGFSGDGGAATSASISYPVFIVLDAAGNLFIADNGNYRIRKVDGVSGNISTLAGTSNYQYNGDGGPATSANLYGPAGVNLDEFGNIYIADQNNNRIRKVDVSTGNISTVAGTGSASFGGDGGNATNAALYLPEDVAADSIGNLYIVDRYNQRIRKVDAVSGIITTVAGNGLMGYSGDGGPATAAKFNHPIGIAIDKQANIYVADANNHRIRKIDALTGIITTVAGDGGTALNNNTGELATNATVGGPEGVTLDAAGNIYIAETGYSRLRKVDVATGIISTLAGTGENGFSGDGDSAKYAKLFFPKKVQVDSIGNIYFTDQGNARIRMINSSTGIITTVAGSGGWDSGDGGPAILASLAGPNGLALDKKGNLFFAESYSQHIRKVDAATGIVETIAGNGAGGYSGDGGSARSAKLNNPMGLTMDGAGNLYFADENNNLIRKLSPCQPIIITLTPAAQSICKGDTAKVVATGGSQYAWSTGSDQSDIAITPTETATYTITVTNSVGCTATASATITVNALPIVIAGKDSAICTGDSIALTASGASSYDWDNSVTNGQYVSPITTTTYTVIGTDSNACSNTAQVVVTASICNLAPELTSVANQTICQDANSGKLSFSIVDEDAASVTMSASSDSTSLVPTNKIVFSGTDTNRTVTITPTAGQSGTVNITLIATDNKGAKGTTTFAVTILPSSGSTETVTNCGNYTWKGTVYTTSGTYKKTISNKAGCDSVMSLQLTINKPTSTCTYSILSSSESFTHTGGNGDIALTTACNCSWTAKSNVIWITISSGSAGTGSGIAEYTVAPNTGTAARTGTITIGGKTFTVTQFAPCTYSISPTIRVFTAASASSTIALSTQGICGWKVRTDRAWVTLTSDTAGVSNATIKYTVGVNNNTARTATINIIGENTTKVFTVTQASGCIYNLNKSGSTFAKDGGKDSILVSSSGGDCPWTPKSNVTWITILSNASNTGNGKVRYQVANYTGTVTRTGIITIADKSYTVTQFGPCAYAVSPTSNTFAATASTGSFSITAQGICGWKVRVNQPWVIITSDTTGTGNAAISYSILANGNIARTATISLIGDNMVKTYAITQAGGCTFNLNQASKAFAKEGGKDSVIVYSTGGDCPWTAKSNVTWITVSSNPSNTGNGKVQYQVAAYTSTVTRTGTLTIAGKTFTVTQFGPCTYAITPTAKTFTAATGTSTIALTAQGLCSWKIRVNQPWITITSDTTGAGNTTIKYTVAVNNNIARTAIINIIGGNMTKTYTITQAGGCVYTLSKTTKTMNKNGGNDTLTVFSSGGDCAWTAKSNVTWISIAAGASSTGTGKVKYAVANNTSGSRTGTITIAGKIYTVSQTNSLRMAMSMEGELTLKIMPNPSEGLIKLNYSIPEAGKASIQIINMLGQTIWNESLQVESGEGEREIDLSTIANGYYFVTIQTGQGLQTEKLIIRH